MGLTHAIFMTCSYFLHLSVIGVDGSFWGPSGARGLYITEAQSPSFPVFLLLLGGRLTSILYCGDEGWREPWELIFNIFIFEGSK